MLVAETLESNSELSALFPLRGDFHFYVRVQNNLELSFTFDVQFRGKHISELERATYNIRVWERLALHR